MRKRFTVVALALLLSSTLGCTARDVRDLIDPHHRFMEVGEDPAHDQVLFPRPQE
jgi:hypothetical protein